MAATFRPKGVFFGIDKFKFYTKTDFFFFKKFSCVIWKNEQKKGEKFLKEVKIEKKHQN